MGAARAELARSNMQLHVLLLNCDGIPSFDGNHDKHNALVALVQQHHLIALLETRTNETTRLCSDSFLPQYTAFHTTVPSDGRKGHGIMVLVRNSLADFITPWTNSAQPTNAQLLWFEIDSIVFGLEGRVCLGVAYINPESRARDTADVEQLFDGFDRALRHASNTFDHVLLLGDFNAHIGTASEFSDDTSPALARFPKLALPRPCTGITDTSTNAAGKRLLDSAASNDLIISTGRVDGDTGQRTFRGYNGNASSRPDHALMTSEVFAMLKAALIADRYGAGLLDHCPLTLNFLVSDALQKRSDLNIGTVDGCPVPTWRWSAIAQQQYFDCLSANTAGFEATRQATSDTATNVEHAYATFLSVVEQAATSCNMLIHRPPRPRRPRHNRPPWFDDRCKLVKEQLRWAKRNGDKETWLPLAAEYRRVRRTAQRWWRRRRAAELVARARCRDNSVFRMLQQKRKPAVTTPVPADTWAQHTETLYAESLEPPPPPPPPLSRGRGPPPLIPLGRGRCTQPPPPVEQPFELPARDKLLELVASHVANMNAASAPGPDRLPSAFIKYAKPPEPDPVDTQDPLTGQGPRGQGAKCPQSNTKRGPPDRDFTGETFPNAADTTAAAGNPPSSPPAECNNILVPLLTDLFALFLRTGAVPQAWKTARLTPLYKGKKGKLTAPGSYRLLAVSSCLYRLYANVVRDIVTGWAVQNNKIPDTQFGFYPGRNTVQPVFILRHCINAARDSKTPLYVAFIDFRAAYDRVNRALLWKHLAALNFPSSLLSVVKGLYDGDSYELQDGPDKRVPVNPTRGVKQGCPLSPILFSLFINDMGPAFDRFRTGGAVTGMGLERGSDNLLALTHLLYADDLTLMARSPAVMNKMLASLSDYARKKDLAVNEEKCEVMMFGHRPPSPAAAAPVFTYPRPDGTVAHFTIVNEFKYLGVKICSTGPHSHDPLALAAEHASRPFMAAVKRVEKLAAEFCVEDRPDVLLWLLQTYGLSAGLYGCQVWGTRHLRNGGQKLAVCDRHVAYIKQVLGVRGSTRNDAALREAGMMPLHYYIFSAVARFWNSLIQQGELDEELGRCPNTLLRDVRKAEMALGKDKRCTDSWFYEVRAALRALLGAQSWRS